MSPSVLRQYTGQALRMLGEIRGAPSWQVFAAKPRGPPGDG